METWYYRVLPALPGTTRHYPVQPGYYPALPDTTRHYPVLPVLPGLPGTTGHYPALPPGYLRTISGIFSDLGA
eukprot:735707-Amorphochlora_amoeboformis.AAC.1